MKLKKFLKIFYFVGLHVFAVIGLLFVGVFFAIRFKWTNVKGSVDEMSGVFQKESEQIKVLGVAGSGVDSINEIAKLSQARNEKIKLICELSELSYVAPNNVKKIMEQRKTELINDEVTKKMIFAIRTKLKNTEELDANIEKCVSGFEETPVSETEIGERVSYMSSVDIFEWVNLKEWEAVNQAITKDEVVIKKAADTAGIDPRLIVSNLMVEQLRTFFSARELYKQYFEPLKILSNSNKISLGVMAIKEETAINVEKHLKDKSSPYYLGEKYEHVLDYATNNVAAERYNRLTENSHYYSYLYAGLYLKQMMKQWKDAGFSIDQRPEIICTLYNVGFPQSKPNNEPKVGGSNIKINEVNYSFGRLGFEFYYSGEMTSQFPYLISFENQL